MRPVPLLLALALVTAMPVAVDASGCLVNLDQTVCEGEPVRTPACGGDHPGDTVDVAVSGTEADDSCDTVDVSVGGREDDDHKDIVDVSVGTEEGDDDFDVLDVSLGGSEGSDQVDWVDVGLWNEEDCDTRDLVEVEVPSQSRPCTGDDEENGVDATRDLPPLPPLPPLGPPGTAAGCLVRLQHTMCPLGTGVAALGCDGDNVDVAIDRMERVEDGCDHVDVSVLAHETTDDGDLVDVAVGGSEVHDEGDVVDVSVGAEQWCDDGDVVDVGVTGWEGMQQPGTTPPCSPTDGGDVVDVGVILFERRDTADVVDVSFGGYEDHDDEDTVDVGTFNVESCDNGDLVDVNVANRKLGSCPPPEAEGDGVSVTCLEPTGSGVDPACRVD